MSAGRLVLRGGLVVDGTGAPARRADVLVVGDRIVEVGERVDVSGARELDASGAFVTPGFVDTHTHLDPSMFWDPSCDPMPQHGVTTALIGNCSLSLVPVRPETIDAVSAVFCFIEDMPRAAFADGIPWNWETFGQYRVSLDERGLAVNAAVLIGHSVLRMYVMGDEAWERAATPDERQALASAFDDAMAAGAFGLSTSRIDVDARRRPVPSRLADDDELDALLAVLERRKSGLVEFIPNFLGDRGTTDLDQLSRMCGRRGVTSVWNGLVHSENDPARSASLMAQVRALRSEGIDVWPMMSPRTLDFRVAWDRSAVFVGLPHSWHRVPNAADDGERRRLLVDPEWRAAARADWDAATVQMFPTKGLDRVRLVEVARPELAPWLGRSLAELVAERGGHPSDVFADWVLENDLHPGVVVVGVANGDVDGVAGLLTDPDTLISASDAGAHVQMMCAAGDTTLLLTRHVRDRGDLTVEQAVAELTAKQARVCGITDRGRVEPGLVADLTVFSLDELSWEVDEFVHDLPGGAPRLRRPPGGYRYTIASGVPTQEHGVLTGALPGGVLDRGGQM
jgi:N-acyl-D-amino-acid deacylase